MRDWAPTLNTVGKWEFIARKHGGGGGGGGGFKRKIIRRKYQK